MDKPLILRPPHCDPLHLLRELKGNYPYCALLESADRAHGVNDLSFLALGAKEVIKTSGSDPLKPFEKLVKTGRAKGQLHMGYIGFLSYESVRFFDEVNLPAEESTPDGLFFLPEVLLRIDHKNRTVTVNTNDEVDLSKIIQAIESSPFLDDSLEKKVEIKLPLTLEEIAPLRMTKREEYCASVEKIQESILAGEAFQVVLSQELTFTAEATALDTYRELRRINPSPYMYFFQSPEQTIVGASPETLIRVDGGEMLYRPIAGTRKRTGDEKADAEMQQELLHDEKECAEHQMLVDLGRNDLGRIAEIGSVRVSNPFHIEKYAHVFHLVSDITATLRKDLTSLDAVRAVFPAGTLSGAPKLRAMEIIREREVSPRGVYGGAFGYIDLSGNLDFAITIRTLIFRGKEVSLRVGAGIVRDSVPELEDNECLHKARSCLAAVRAASSSPLIPCAR